MGLGAAEPTFYTSMATSEPEALPLIDLGQLVLPAPLQRSNHHQLYDNSTSTRHVSNGESAAWRRHVSMPPTAQRAPGSHLGEAYRAEELSRKQGVEPPFFEYAGDPLMVHEVIFQSRG